MKSTVLDELDFAILDVAYHMIEGSASKRVSGDRIWAIINGVCDIAPIYIPGRTSRLISQGLLSRDMANSSSRARVYAPTAAGYEAWKAKTGTSPFSSFGSRASRMVEIDSDSLT